MNVLQAVGLSALQFATMSQSIQVDLRISSQASLPRIRTMEPTSTTGKSGPVNEEKLVQITSFFSIVVTLFNVINCNAFQEALKSLK